MKQPAINLRALEPEDLDELYTIENDRETWNAGHTNVPYSRYALHDYIARQQADIYADRQLRLVVENAEKQIVGLVDLMNFDPRHRRAELGIVVKKPFRRSGYGLAAIAQMLDYARKTLHLHQVYAIVDAGNDAARQLFLQADFKQHSTLSDWLFDGVEYRKAVLMQTFL